MQKSVEMRYTEDKEYSTKLLIEGHKINTKIMEQSEMLVCAKDKQEIVGNTADLLYYTMLFLNKNSIDISDVEKELIKRRYAVVKKDLSCKIEKEEFFTVGVVGSHCDDNVAIEFLQQTFSTKIEKVGNKRNYLLKSDKENLKIVIVKPKDINTLITNGFIDAILSYEDMILNSSLIVEKITVKKIDVRPTKIVIACKENLNLNDFVEINKERQLIIMAEYLKFVVDWVREMKLNANVIHVHGSSESYIVNDLCDMIVAVCDTGTTLRENNLKVLHVLAETSMFLFVHPDKKYKLEKVL